MKCKTAQLSLFDAVDIHTEDHFWQEFKAVVIKLKQEGLRSLSVDWWRSRYWEHIECPNHAPNKKGWQYQHAASKAWKYIWQNHRSEITA